MGAAATDVPKPLLCVSGKELITHKLDALPEAIKEIVLVIGHNGDKIRERYGDWYGARPITYVEDKTISGTAHALWHAKDVLGPSFLVLMGDDIYSAESLRAATKITPTIVCKKAFPGEVGSRVLTDKEGCLTDFVTDVTYQKEHTDGGVIFTGLYALTSDIFQYEPVKMKTKDEWGLPQTLAVYAKDHPVSITLTERWLSVGTPEEIVAAETILANLNGEMY